MSSGTGRSGFRVAGMMLGVAVLLAACGGAAVDDGAPVGLPPYGLRGQVVTSAGDPVVGASVSLIKVSDGTFLTETDSHADGWFAFLVFDGAYRLEVTVAGFEVTPSGQEATVAGRDVDLPRFLATPLP